MDTILQIWGGVGFLLNKGLLMLSEKQKSQGNQSLYQKYQICSWLIYFISLPPWIILFAIKQNWIASALELAGVPAIILGLINSIQINNQTLTKKTIRFFEGLSIICIIVGISYSLYDLNGISRFTQILELVLTTSYLVGTYLLAKANVSGYIYYICMHISCGLMMYIQGYFWLFLQQFVSLLFMANSYYIATKKSFV